MRSGVHALALLALLAAAPAQAFITGESAAPSALVSASLGLRLRGGGKPADGKVRLRLRVQIWKHIDKHACLLLAPPPACLGRVRRAPLRQPVPTRIRATKTGAELPPPTRMRSLLHSRGPGRAFPLAQIVIYKEDSRSDQLQRQCTEINAKVVANS
jgi:hypothetical protein